MDLYKEWDTLNRTKFNNPQINKQEIMEAINQESQLSLAVLKKRLRYKINWIILFIAIPAVWMLFSLKDTELLMILTVPLVLNTIYLIPTVLNYRKIQLDNSLTLNTVQAIKTNVSIIKSTLRLEMLTSAFGMPVSVVYGILLGSHIVGKSISATIHNPALLITGIISLVILVPLGMIAGVKMNESAFGKHLQQLQENMTRLEVLN